MGYLKVDQAGAASIVRALQQNASAREADIRTLSNQAAPGDVWVGQAANAYQNAYLQWEAAERNLVTALQNLAQQAQRIVNAFEQIDQQGAGAF